MKKLSKTITVLALSLSCFSCYKDWEYPEKVIQIDNVSIVEVMTCVGEDILSISPKYNKGNIAIKVDADATIISRDSICEVTCKLGTTDYMFTDLPFEVKEKAVLNPDFTDSLKMSVKYIRNDEFKKSIYSGVLIATKDNKVEVDLSNSLNMISNE